MRVTHFPTFVFAIGLAALGCQPSAGEEGGSSEMGMEDVQKTQLVENFRADARGRLEAIDRNIQILRERADSAGGEIQTELSEKVAEFQNRSEQLEQELRNLTWESEAAWNESQDLVNRALEGLAQDVDALLSPSTEGV